MKYKIIEVTNPTKDGHTGSNWGKFLCLQFDEEEWGYKSQLPCDEKTKQIQQMYPFLKLIGYSHKNIWVLDLQTREGGAFLPGGCAEFDLEQKKIWVCPMYEPFLKWLYSQNLTDITTLPAVVELNGVVGAWRGYRRQGVEVFSAGAGI